MTRLPQRAVGGAKTPMCAGQGLAGAGPGPHYGSRSDSGPQRRNPPWHCIT